MAGEPSDKTGPPAAGVARLGGIGAAGDVPASPVVTFGRDGVGPAPPGDTTPTAAFDDLADTGHTREHGGLGDGAPDDRSRQSVTLGGLPAPAGEVGPVAGLSDLDGRGVQAQRAVRLDDLVAGRSEPGRRAERGGRAARSAGAEGGIAGAASGRRARRTDRRGRASSTADGNRDTTYATTPGDAVDRADRTAAPAEAAAHPVAFARADTGADQAPDVAEVRSEPAPADPSRDHGSRRRRPGYPARELAPDADPVAAAREICLRLLSDRARTRQELAQALRRRGVPDEAAHAVLERFDEVGLIDDTAFAGQWVRSRHAHRGLARRAIAVELRRKGVADDVAGEALGEVDAESEERRARQLVDRKLRSLAAVTPEQRAIASRRLVGMLARKGYGAGVAYRVVRDALVHHGADTDELGSEEPPEG